MTATIAGHGVVPGVAAAPALVSGAPVSFLGDVDIATGEVVGGDSPIRGRVLAGAALIMPAAVGSAGAWRFLYQLAVHGTAPAAIVIEAEPDASLIQGAMLAGVPVLCRLERPLAGVVATGQPVVVDATAGVLRVGS